VVRFFLPFAIFAGCDFTPCDQYVQYMCDCHPEADCAELRSIYADAGADVQEQCAIALDEQESADGGECPPEDTDPVAES